MAAGEVIKEFFITLGLQPDQASFATGVLAVRGLEFGLNTLVDAARSTAQAFVDGVFSTANYAREMKNFASQAGLSISQMEGVAYAINLTGASINTLVGNLAQGLRTGGINDMHTLLLDIAEQFETVTNEAERVRIVTKHFGEEGRKLVPIFLDGRKALEDLFNEIVPLTTSQIKDTEAFNLAWQRLTATVNLAKREAFIQLFPILTRILVVTRSVIKEVREWVKLHWPDILKATKVAALLLAGVLGAQLLQAIGAALTALRALTAAQVSYGMTSLVAGARAAAGAAMALLPWVLIAAAIAVALDEFIAYERGGKTAIGALSTMWNEWIGNVLKPLDTDTTVGAFVKAWIRGLMDLEGTFDKFSVWVHDLFKSVARMMAELMDKVPFGAGAWSAKTLRSFADNLKPRTTREAFSEAYDMFSKADDWTGKYFQKGTDAAQGLLTAPLGDVPDRAAGMFRAPSTVPSRPAAEMPNWAAMQQPQVTIDAPITVNAAPGMDTKELAAEVARQSEERWKVKMRQTLTGTPQ
jgi:hypothetical protein